MEKLGEVIKIFLEKHFIPTVISFVVSAAVYACTPNEFWLIVKFTELGYWLFCSGVIFILIQFILWINKQNCEKKEKKELQERNELRKKKKMERELECLWDFVDNLCGEDIKYLKTFLKKNNAPIVIRGNTFFSYDRLLGSYRTKRQEGYDAEGHYVKYILETDFYELLKFSAEEHGRISHFEKM